MRLVTATNRNLEELVKAGKFREDLFFRLRVVEIELPPLRDRTGDIPLLAHAFLREFSRENGKPVNDFTVDALEAMMNYAWPGNVRELRTAIEHGVVLSRGDRISLRDLPSSVRGGANAGETKLLQGKDLTVKDAGKTIDHARLAENRRQPHARRTEDWHEPPHFSPQIARLPVGRILNAPTMTTTDRIQSLIHTIESGKGNRLLWILATTLALAGLMVWYDVWSYRGFSAPDAMDAAQVGRNLAEGHGFTTQSISPFRLYLAQKKDHTAGLTTVLPAQPGGFYPDEVNPPVYPIVLAGLLKLTHPNWTVDLKKSFGFRSMAVSSAFNRSFSSPFLQPTPTVGGSEFDLLSGQKLV